MRNLGLLGDLAKGFVILTFVIWVFALVVNIATGQIWIVSLLLILLIPLSMVAVEYLKYQKKERT